MAFEKMTIRVISMDEDYAKSIVDALTTETFYISKGKTPIRTFMCADQLSLSGGYWNIINRYNESSDFDICMISKDLDRIVDGSYGTHFFLYDSQETMIKAYPVGYMGRSNTLYNTKDDTYFLNIFVDDQVSRPKYLKHPDVYLKEKAWFDEMVLRNQESRYNVSNVVMVPVTTRNSAADKAHEIFSRYLSVYENKQNVTEPAKVVRELISRNNIEAAKRIKP